MENLKHTQGKWQYDFSTPKQQSEKYNGANTGGLCRVFVETDKKIFGRPTHDTVCDLLHWRDNDKNDEVLANAKLIASAPELLETLQRVLNDFENCTWTEETNNMIKKAIKKATK